MKKLFCMILCVTVLMLSASVFALSDNASCQDDGLSSFSPREVCIIPDEGQIGEASVQTVLLSRSIMPLCLIKSKNIRQEDKYFPDILEQIDIISVAPRE